jgi:hypothetical protein
MLPHPSGLGLGLGRDYTNINVKMVCYNQYSQLQYINPSHHLSTNRMSSLGEIAQISVAKNRQTGITPLKSIKSGKVQQYAYNYTSYYTIPPTFSPIGLYM